MHITGANNLVSTVSNFEEFAVYKNIFINLPYLPIILSYRVTEIHK